jgi:uncharacterized coiled-coil DUF342 family protein
MEPNAYVITFPMVMSGVMGIVMLIVGFFVRKWMADSDRAEEQRGKLVDNRFTEIKNLIESSSRDVHESFVTVHKRIDDIKDKRDEDQKAIADLRVDLAKAVTREELNELRNHFDSQMQKLNQLITALVGKS